MDSNIYILLSGREGGGAYTQDKTIPMQELELKLQGGLMHKEEGGGA